MCLRSVHFPLPAVPVVPRGGSAAGQGTENGPVPPAGRRKARRMWGAVHPRLQPGRILPGMCAESPPAANGRGPKTDTAWTIEESRRVKKRFIDSIVFLTGSRSAYPAAGRGLFLRPAGQSRRVGPAAFLRPPGHRPTGSGGWDRGGGRRSRTRSRPCPPGTP